MFHSKNWKEKSFIWLWYSGNPSKIICCYLKCFVYYHISGLLWDNLSCSLPWDCVSPSNTILWLQPSANYYLIIRNQMNNPLVYYHHFIIFSINQFECPHRQSLPVVSVFSASYSYSEFFVSEEILVLFLLASSSFMWTWNLCLHWKLFVNSSHVLPFIPNKNFYLQAYLPTL